MQDQVVGKVKQPQRKHLDRVPGKRMLFPYNDASDLVPDNFVEDLFQVTPLGLHQVNQQEVVQLLVY